MSFLTATDVISIWESSQRRPPGEKIFTLLAAAFPGERPDHLARLSLGQTNRRLLELREQIFGSRLSASSDCLHCDTRFEFDLPAEVFRRTNLNEPVDAEYEVESGEYSVCVRPVNLADLTFAAKAHTLSNARQQIIKRCVLKATRAQSLISAEQLPNEVVAALAERLAESDPEAELLCDLTCPACGFEFQLPFDLSAFFFAEIDAEARRLLREVHVLAYSYGWGEAEILQMPALRRRFYLEMLDQ
jgi:hypothetical protein